tara:strand:+ start:2204 stop:3121 length:918 start_codon:yes stop_codon:yes gene_type:complete
MERNLNPHPKKIALFLIVFAFLFLPTIDALAKLLGDRISAGQIAWCRFLIQTILMGPIFFWALRKHKVQKILLQFMRGVLIASTTVLIFASVKFMPLAEVIAIFFIEPLLVTMLSAIILGERLGWKRLAATTVGFFGALVVVQPNYELFGLLSFLPFLAALSFAFYMILTRKLSQVESAGVLQFNSGLSGLIFMSVMLATFSNFDIPMLEIKMPQEQEWILLILIGVIATLGHFILAFASKYIEANILAPFQYFEIVGATFLGFWLFGDFPAPIAWLGIITIVLSGIYVFKNETSKKTGFLQKKR